MSESLGTFWAYMTSKGNLIPSTVRESMTAADKAVRESQPGRRGVRVERVRIEAVRVSEEEEEGEK